MIKDAFNTYREKINRDYFGEYITDGYIIERIIANCEPDEGYLSDDEEHEEEVLHDIHYDEVKEFFKKEGEVDE